MECLRPTKCNSFTKNSCIEWSAWPRNLFNLRISYARWLTWSGLRSLVKIYPGRIIDYSSLDRDFFCILLKLWRWHAERGFSHPAWLEKQQALWKCFQYPFQPQQVYGFWDSGPVSYSSGGKSWNISLLFMVAFELLPNFFPGFDSQTHPNAHHFLFWLVQERENPTLTEWDRFAHREYIRLSMEEDGEDASNGSGDVWDESLEAPFWIHLKVWSSLAAIFQIQGFLFGVMPHKMECSGFIWFLDLIFAKFHRTWRFDWYS